MINLTTPADTLELVSGNAVSGLDVLASWEDESVGNQGPVEVYGRQPTTILTAATTTIVAAPPSQVNRSIKSLSVRNTTLVANQITIQVRPDGAAPISLLSALLLPGNAIEYGANGFGVIDANGIPVVVPLAGRFLGTTVLTGPSGNFTTGPQTTTIKVKGDGGGGGGGGCTSVAAAAGAAGGGGGGAYCERTFAVTPNTAYAYVCGAAGAGATAGPGTNGGASSFGPVGGVTLLAPGGSGAPVNVPAAIPSTSPGGAGALVATGGNVNAGGSNGQPGILMTVAGPVGVSGNGGFARLGGGGGGISVPGTGNNANGFGGGGGGALTGASAPRAGGNGSPGEWIVDEYS